MNNPISGIILLIGLVIEKPLLAVGCLIGLSVLDECTSSFSPPDTNCLCRLGLGDWVCSSDWSGHWGQARR